MDLHKHVACSPLAASFCVFSQAVITSLRTDGLEALASLQALAHKVYHLKKRYNACSSGLTSMRRVARQPHKALPLLQGQSIASKAPCIKLRLCAVYTCLLVSQDVKDSIAGQDLQQPLNVLSCQGGAQEERTAYGGCRDKKAGRQSKACT